MLMRYLGPDLEQTSGMLGALPRPAKRGEGWGEGQLGARPSPGQDCGLSLAAPPPRHERVHARLQRAMAGRGHIRRRSFVGAQVLPLRIFKLARDERVEFCCEHAQGGIAARVRLVEPPEQDHVGDRGDVATPIARLWLSPQAPVALENRLDVLCGAGDHRAGAVERDSGAHGSGGRRLDDVVGAPDDQPGKRLADERLDERHVIDLHLLLAAFRCDLGQAEALHLVLGGKILLVGIARQQRRAGHSAQGGVFFSILDSIAGEVLDQGGKVDFHRSSMLKQALRKALRTAGVQVSRIGADPFRDVDAVTRSIYEAVKQFTVTGPAAVFGLGDAVRYVARANISGTFVECGVFKGGSSMAAALMAKHLGIGIDLHLFDTFEGMPPPTERDSFVLSPRPVLGFDPKTGEPWTSDDEATVRATWQAPAATQRVYIFIAARSNRPSRPNRRRRFQCCGSMPIGTTPPSTSSCTCGPASHQAAS